MASHGGIGTYVRNLVPRIMSARRDWRFTLLGDVETMRRLGWADAGNVRLVASASSYYTIAEQVELPFRSPGDASAYWVPHYNMPLLQRAPTIVTVHDVCHVARPESTRNWMERTYAQLMFRAVAARASCVLFDSEFTRREMSRFAPPRGDTVVAPLGVDPEWFRARTDAGARPLAEAYVVYVGNWKRHKNLSTLARAFRQATQSIPHRLVIVGQQEGLNADADAARAMQELGDRVLVVGKVDEDALRRWVAHADALVTVSSYEGFGLPPLEAMAAGRPCLVSDAGALPEVCGDAALYCNPRDEEDVARGLTRIVSDATLREALIGRGIERARTFTWERCASTTAAAIERVVAARQQS